MCRLSSTEHFNSHFDIVSKEYYTLRFLPSVTLGLEVLHLIQKDLGLDSEQVYDHEYQLFFLVCEIVLKMHWEVMLIIDSQYILIGRQFVKERILSFRRVFRSVSAATH